MQYEDPNVGSPVFNHSLSSLGKKFTSRPPKINLAMQMSMSMSSQQSDERQLLNQLGKPAALNYDEKRHDVELLIDDSESPIILPLDKKNGGA